MNESLEAVSAALDLAKIAEPLVTGEVLDLVRHARSLLEQAEALAYAPPAPTVEPWAGGQSRPVGKSPAHDPSAYAHFAEGVFRFVTGQPVGAHAPAAKRAGYEATVGMTITEKRRHYDYCVTELGYVDPLPHWADNPKHWTPKEENP